MTSLDCLVFAAGCVEDPNPAKSSKSPKAEVTHWEELAFFGTGLEVIVSRFLFLVFRGGESVRSTTESLLLSLSDHMIFLWKYLLSSSIQGMAKKKCY